MFLGFHHSPPPKLKFLETRMKKKTKKIKIKTISKANIKKKKKKSNGRVWEEIWKQFSHPDIFNLKSKDSHLRLV